MDARLDAGTDMLSLREAGRLPAHEVPTAPPAVHDSSSPSPSPSSASVERSGGSDSAHDERFPPALGAARRLSGESATSESQARGDMPTSFTGGTQEAASKRGVKQTLWLGRRKDALPLALRREMLAFLTAPRANER